MKLKNGVIFSDMDGQVVLVAAGDAGKAFSGMMKLNETAAFLAKMMNTEITKDQLAEALLKEYDCTREQAEQSVDFVKEKLESAGLLA